MSDIRFEWDPRKAAANERRHGVCFEEGQTVFYDDYALLIDDPEHSTEEDRFILLGMSAALRIVVVVHAYRERDAVIRLISARKATRSERKHYEEGRRQ